MLIYISSFFKYKDGSPQALPALDRIRTVDQLCAYAHMPQLERMHVSGAPLAAVILRTDSPARHLLAVAPHGKRNKKMMMKKRVCVIEKEERAYAREWLWLRS